MANFDPNLNFSSRGPPAVVSSPWMRERHGLGDADDGESVLKAPPAPSLRSPSRTDAQPRGGRPSTRSVNRPPPPPSSPSMTPPSRRSSRSDSQAAVSGWTPPKAKYTTVQEMENIILQAKRDAGSTSGRGRFMVPPTPPPSGNYPSPAMSSSGSSNNTPRPTHELKKEKWAAYQPRGNDDSPFSPSRGARSPGVHFELGPVSEKHRDKNRDDAAPIDSTQPSRRSQPRLSVDFSGTSGGSHSTDEQEGPGAIRYVPGQRPVRLQKRSSSRLLPAGSEHDSVSSTINCVQPQSENTRRTTMEEGSDDDESITPSLDTEGNADYHGGNNQNCISFTVGMSKREFMIILVCLFCIVLPLGLVVILMKPTVDPPEPLDPVAELKKIIGTNFRLDHNDDSFWEDEASPQNKAIDWLVNHDVITKTTVLPMLPDNVENTRQLEQRYALAVFYFSTGGKFPTNDGTGSSTTSTPRTAEKRTWTKSNYFLNPTEHECAWNSFGVEYEDSGVYDMAVGEGVKKFQGVICNRQDEIITIKIQNNVLAGPIPQELIALSALTSFEVNNVEDEFANKNVINGTFPEFQLKRGLPRLRRLHLGDNQLSGDLPLYTYGQWTDLESLRLEGNSFSSFLPNNWQHLTNLKVLVLNENNIGGTIPDGWKTLRSLNNLSLSKNSLEGTIPRGVLQLPQLGILNLESNILTGTIPSSGFGDKLNNLNLAFNKLSGNFPWEATSGRLKEIRLTSNFFSGTIAWDEVVKMNILNLLDLEQNDFTGTIAPHIGNATKLQSMKLSGNKLYGTIPKEIGNLSTLIGLRLNNNLLTGQLPTEIGELKNLEELYVAWNGNLNGTVPKELAALDNFDKGQFAGNDFTGSLGFLCEDDRTWDILTADCEGDEPKIECPCCTNCE